jgi:hypothetical protein
MATVPWPFLHSEQQRISPKGAVARLTLSATTLKNSKGVVALRTLSATT